MMLALQLLAFVGAVQCLPWDGVKPTRIFDQPLGFQEPPKPTQAAAVDLRKRQAPGDVTCGYAAGISSAALYCLSQGVCATNSLGGMGCCYSEGLDNCLLPTACIDSTALGHYGSSYLANPYVTSCTDATAPLCITEYFEYNVEATGYNCGDPNSFLTLVFLTTAFNTTVPSISVFNAFYSPTASVTSTSSSSPPTTTTTTSPSPISTSSQNPLTSPSTSFTPIPAPGPSPTPIGAIVGGVVGGVAAVAIGGLILFLLLRRRNKRQDNTTQPQYPAVAPMQQTQGPLPPQPQQMYSQQQQYQYPSPSSAHPPPQTYGYQTAYPEKTSPQEITYQVHGSPQLAHNEPVGSGLERMSVVPPYSSGPNSAGGFDSKDDMAINTPPGGNIHELSEQNQYNIHQ